MPPKVSPIAVAPAFHVLALSAACSSSSASASSSAPSAQRPMPPAMTTPPPTPAITQAAPLSLPPSAHRVPSMAPAARPEYTDVRGPGLIRCCVYPCGRALAEHRAVRTACGLRAPSAGPQPEHHHRGRCRAALTPRSVTPQRARPPACRQPAKRSASPRQTPTTRHPTSPPAAAHRSSLRSVHRRHRQRPTHHQHPATANTQDRAHQLTAAERATGTRSSAAFRLALKHPKISFRTRIA